MAIKVNCAKCGGHFSAAEHHAGKSGKCPRCQQPVKIPAGVAAVGTTGVPPGTIASHLQRRNPEQIAAQIRGAFTGPIERVRTSLSYKFGLSLATALMLMLPGVYLAIAALVAYGIYLHVIHATFILNAPRLMGLLLYATPPVAGGILLFFMVKPLFAPARDRSGTRSLTRDGEPLLFDFVDQICLAVGSAKPSRIDVDSQVNASAGFLDGWRGLVGGKLVLTIGVPLVAGLDTRQFAGVLAHEFGHFSQGAGMRLSYVVRSINAWFVRVVYERDAWDDWLEQAAADNDWRISIILHLTRLCIWLTRRILWALMMLGHIGSCLLMREMEYDADRYETRLVGGDTFERTHLRICVLGAAQGAAMNELSLIMKEGRLADNFPKYIVATADSIPPPVREKIHAAISDEKTSWFDTHPSASQRIENARRERTDGVFGLAVSSTLLFSNFDQLAKNVTWDIYRSAFGPKFNREHMHDTDQLLLERNKSQESDKSIDSYCQGCFTLLRPLQLPQSAPQRTSHPRNTLEALKETRQRFLSQQPEYLQLLKQYDQADDQLLEARQAHQLLYAGASIPKDLFKINTASTSSVARTREQAQTTQGRLDDKLKVCEQALGERLHLALQLLAVPQVAERVPNAAQVQRDTLRFYATLHPLLLQFSTFKQLRNEFAALGCLCRCLKPRHNSENLIDSIQRAMKEVYRLLADLHRDLAQIDYPFQHQEASISIGRYCVPSLPTPDDLGGLMHSSNEMLGAVAVVYRRLVKELVVVAEQVETAVGLPKLPPPPDETEN